MSCRSGCRGSGVFQVQVGRLARGRGSFPPPRSCRDCCCHRVHISLATASAKRVNKTEELWWCLPSPARRCSLSQAGQRPCSGHAGSQWCLGWSPWQPRFVLVPQALCCAGASAGEQPGTGSVQNSLFAGARHRDTEIVVFVFLRGKAERAGAVRPGEERAQRGSYQCL